MQWTCVRMNAQYLLLILLNGWFFNKFITTTVAISQVKQNLLKPSKTTHARRLQPSARNYVYLNYKETYGLRFDPKKIHIKRQSNGSSGDEQPMWNDVPSISMPTPMPVAPVTTMESDRMQTISVAAEMVPNLTTTIASPSSTDISIATSSTTTTTTTSTQSTTTDDKVTSSVATRPNKQPVLAFSSLLNWKSAAAKRQNATKTTTTIQRTSSLKEKLQLIRKRIKQWFSFGTNTKASLVNGQRFLNVFNVINFETGPCTSTQEGLTEMSGICYQDFQCTEMGGESIDECADGLGVCCVCKNAFSHAFHEERLSSQFYFYLSLFQHFIEWKIKFF